MVPGLNVKGIGSVVQVKDRYQGKERAQQGIEEEFERCIDAVLAAPYADDDVHRY